MGPKKIEAYLDIVSPYSFYAFTYLRRNKAALEALGVELDFIPVFLGGINVGSGNKPPWTLPAKATYSQFDGPRAQKYFGVKFDIPSFFPILSLLPMRCLTYLKKEIPDKVEPVFASFFEAMWLEHRDISKPEELTTALLKVFDRDSVEKLIHAANLPETKQRLNQVTTYVHQELGAFGCPWFTVHNGEGKAEPFFGSDRFHYMWDFLDLPHQDLELKDPSVPKL